MRIYRIIMLGAVAAVGVTASAHAATGALTFSSCAVATPFAAPPCTASAAISGPTVLAGDNATIALTDGTGNSFAALTRGTFAPTLCAGDGSLTGCPTPAGVPATAFADAEGFASLPNQAAVFVAGSTNNDIAEILPRGDECISQGVLAGCSSSTAHGLTHPTQLALAPAAPGTFPTQLYAASADGVSWFNISSSGFHLTWANCVNVGATGGCSATTTTGAATSIAISPDGQNVYVGSSNGTVLGYHRAANGDLTQTSCITETASPPSGCVHGHGIQRISGIAVSPDGQSVYTVSTLGEAVVTFNRASDGTLTQRSGCVAATSADGCTALSQITTVDSVAVSPDGRNVYVGDTGADVTTFDRAADGFLTAAGCVSRLGSICATTTFSHYSGGVSVSPDGKWVDVTAQDSQDVSSFARTRQSADLEISGAPALIAAPAPASGVAVSRTFTIVNHGPDEAPGGQVEIDFPTPTISASGTATGGGCADVSPDSHNGELLCPLGTLASGTSATVSLTMTDFAPVGPFAPTIVATARPAVYVDDPVAANNELDTTLTTCPGFVTAQLPVPADTCSPLPPSGGATTTTTPPPAPKPKLAISSAKITPSTFAVKSARKRTSGRHHAHQGATIAFKLSHAAAVTITFASVRTGHRSHGSCRTTAHHGATCTVTRTVGTMLVKAASTTNADAFSGRVHGVALKPGRYRATISARQTGFTDAAPRALSFTVVAG
jgi:hypothetical protein